LSQDARDRLAGRPELECPIQLAIGNCFQDQLCRPDQAEPILRRAVRLASQASIDPSDRAGIEYAWARSAAMTTPCAEAEAVFLAHVAEWDRLGVRDLRAASTLVSTSWSLVNRGKPDEAQKFLDEATSRVNRQSLAMQAHYKPFLRPLRAYILLGLHKPREAEQIELPVDVLLSKTGPANLMRQDMEVQAAIQAALGNNKKARALWERDLALMLEGGISIHDILGARQHIAGLAWLDGDLEAAEQQFAQIATTAATARDHGMLAQALSSRGVCLRDLGRTAEAQTILEQALEIVTADRGKDDPGVANTHLNLARLFLTTNRPDAALQQASESLRIYTLHYGDAHRASIEALAVTGLARARLHGPEAGLPDLTLAYRHRVEHGLLTEWRTDIAPDALTEVLTSLGRAGEAESLIEGESLLLSLQFGPDNAATKRALARLSRLRNDLNTSPSPP
jgi:tetratricopeptide (TPR) repeat protein